MQQQGSPVHAGIDRSNACGQVLLLLLGFPRTRGDRPVSAGEAPHVEGSPVHAGIDRRGSPGGNEMTGFPRTRGDRPRTLCAVLGFLPMSVPPYTRG